MVDKNFVQESIRMFFSWREIESMTRRLDNAFPELNLKDLLEYGAVVDALKAYAEAAVSRYQEHSRGLQEIAEEGTK